MAESPGAATVRPVTVILTSGEPAGIGPDLCAAAAAQPWPGPLVIAGDRPLIAERGRQLGLRLRAADYDPSRPPTRHQPGTLLMAHEPLRAPCTPGQLDVRNAPYVLALLDRACDGCTSGEFAAMVTAPVQKSVINDAGTPFAGHTEYLAARTGGDLPVMLLVADRLRVALATTHLPLSEVPAAITREGLAAVLDRLNAGLRDRFGIGQPRIHVTGLNPHSGEGGHLGREEIEVISPAIAEARARGIDATGPWPADTVFTPQVLAGADAVLAMFHDQGLPVLKHAGFGRAVNVTLGLPIIRTSVDHGTALELAGSGKADAGSLFTALELAYALAARQHR